MTEATTTPYLVLARKYRPTSFADLKGQEALVRTLTNAIRMNRIAQAFLLTGIRGIGKTTTARIIARSLNCIGPDGQGGPTTSPCGVCVHCTSIAGDRHPDILEMDAASRTGVNDIREIIDNVYYLPTSARYKIYIIDEVHMLSNNAFNALLKTLEEPPPHVKFIFATTEIRKIPITILSRCQRFDLHRLSNAAMAEHLANVAGKEQFTAEPEALALLANAAEGSVRDGLSLLDQAIAHTCNEEGSTAIKAETVRHMLGVADKSAVTGLCEALAGGDAAQVLERFDALYAQGADPVLVLNDLLEMTHAITQIKANPNGSQALPETMRAVCVDLAGKLSMAFLTRCWQMLLKGLQEVQSAPSAKMAAEMVLVRIAYSAMLPAPATIIKSIKDGTAIPAPAPQTLAPAPVLMAEKKTSDLAPIAPIAAPVVAPIAAPPVAEAPSPRKIPTQFEEVVALFAEHQEPLLYNWLRMDVYPVACEPGKLTIRTSKVLPQDFAHQIGQKLTEWTGMRWGVTLSQETGGETLKQRDDNAKEVYKQHITAHPHVKAILDTFPGAVVHDVVNVPKKEEV